MMRLFSLIFTSSLILLSIENANAASDSITYSIAEKMINSAEIFTLNLYSAIALAYRPLYIKIASIGLMVILAKYLFTKVAPLREMLSFMVAMIISSSLAFDSGLFKEFVYDTFFDLLYQFDQFIVRSAAGNIPSNIRLNSLSDVFRTIDDSLIGISQFAIEASRENKISLGNLDNLPGFILVTLEAWLIWLLYLFVGVYFLIIFTIAIFGAHMMMIMLPITISFYPFKRLRHYLTNCINGIFHYGLVTVFSCVSIAVVVFITQDLKAEAERIRIEAANGPYEIPVDFLTAAIMVGFISIFLIKVSTEFASRIINSASSQLGGAFPMIIAGATTIAKSTNMAARVGQPIVSTGYRAGAQGVSYINSLRNRNNNNQN